MTRRIRAWAAGLAVCVLYIASAADGRAQQDTMFSQVAAKASDLASRQYVAPDMPLPTVLDKLTYDEYRKVRFQKANALWRGEALFQVEFFHPGFLYKTPVKVNVVEDGTPRRLGFSPAMFVYDGLSIDQDALPADLGFAGFRLHYPINKPGYPDEVAVFLGASYFRILGRGQTYGLSLRGIAVNTAEPSGEEFPAFREFWLVKPAAEATTLTVYALLDGPSVTGAYRFDITPGAGTTASVRKQLFFRNGVRRLGVAPLTSMFLYGENRTRHFDDYRPEVHDSDGLLMQNGSGEWIWRALTNPRDLRVSSFSDQNPRGFGLMQRDRDFRHYQDTESHFERRPSAWVVPEGEPWGWGSVQLVEIPSQEEIHDNIVAFWAPTNAPKAGDVQNYRYTIHTVSRDPASDALGRVENTRIGWAAVPGTENKPPKSLRRFVVEFRGGELAELAAEQPVKADLTASRGQVSDVVVSKVPDTQSWRVAFLLRPGSEEPVDMRLFLSLRGQRLTETWSYLWSPNEIR